MIAEARLWPARIVEQSLGLMDLTHPIYCLTAHRMLEATIVTDLMKSEPVIVQLGLFGTDVVYLEAVNSRLQRRGFDVGFCSLRYLRCAFRF